MDVVVKFAERASYQLDLADGQIMCRLLTPDNTRNHSSCRSKLRDIDSATVRYRIIRGRWWLKNRDVLYQDRDMDYQMPPGAAEYDVMPTKGAPTPDEFIRLYERSLAQRWHAVDPFIHEDACVTFSNGTVHVGKAAVQLAFEGNFEAIVDEDYRISNIRWVYRGSDVAVYLFDFNWSGRVGGRPASGSGRGTSVLRRDDGGWRLLVEHLGPGAA